MPDELVRIDVARGLADWQANIEGIGAGPGMAAVLHRHQGDADVRAALFAVADLGPVAGVAIEAAQLFGSALEPIAPDPVTMAVHGRQVAARLAVVGHDLIGRAVD